MRAGMFAILLVPVLAVPGLGCSTTNTNSHTEAPVQPEPGEPVPKAVNDIDQKFWGSSFAIAETKNETTTLHSFATKGKSGAARVNALLVYKTIRGTTDADGKLGPPAEKEGCPATCGHPKKKCTYGAELVSMTWVQAYNDGSAFSGALPTDPEDAKKRIEYFEKSIVCTNGSDLYVKAKGIIIDVNGSRFKGLAGGTWEVEATTSTYLTKGTFTAGPND